MQPNYRRCVSCRKIALKQEFWRIVRVHSPSKQSTPTVQLDVGMGRSVYLCPQAACLKLAQKKERLGRALKATVADQVYQTLWQRLSASEAERHQSTQAVSTLNGTLSNTTNRQC